ncbi:hypothetical protein SASPL_118528 [Salvia splendens]|uniref:Uncharacterized protein n=1 Tax=Salvia splendens TaxID=180675 RepID=A0A8X8Y1T4_SALSN|nr:hypothetical protein SASPL_118528 [Salvia splendens]
MQRSAMAKALFQSSSLACSSTMDISYNSSKASHIFGSQLRSPEIEQTQLRFLDSSKQLCSELVIVMMLCASCHNEIKTVKQLVLNLRFLQLEVP